MVVAGGDGSIKKVALAIAGRGIPMAILPIGTANNIAKSLGALGSRLGADRGLAGGRTPASGGRDGRDPVGIDAVRRIGWRGCVHRARHSRRRGGEREHDRADRARDRPRPAAAPAHRGGAGSRFRQLELDGSDLSGEYLLVEVMNMPLVGPNIPLAPGADYGDEQLEVVTVTEREREVLAEYVRARLSGGAAPPELTVRRGHPGDDARVSRRAARGRRGMAPRAADRRGRAGAEPGRGRGDDRAGGRRGRGLGQASSERPRRLHRPRDGRHVPVVGTAAPAHDGQVPQHERSS